MQLNKFKPKFLFTDQNHIDNLLKQATENIPNWEKILLYSSNVFETQLTESEKPKLLIEKMKFVHDKLKRESNISGVDIKMWIKMKEGLEAKIEHLESLFYKNGYFNPKDYTIKGNKISIVQGYEEALKKQYTYYTDHQKQNDTLIIANELSDVLNKTFKMGIFYIDKNPTSFNSTTIRDYIKPLKKLIEVENKKIVPNFKEIWRLKNN